MRFEFKQNQENIENQDNKQQNKVTILSYKTAYNRLIQHINQKYWKLDWVELDCLDKGLMEDKEVIGSQIGFFLPKKSGALYDGSKSAGEKRLIEFLRCIYIIQAYTPSEEGCLPLLKCLDGIMTSKKGYHFPNQIANAIVQGKLWAARLQPHESAVNLSGKLAIDGRQTIESLRDKAEIRYNRYFADNNSTLSDNDMILLSAGI